MKAGIEGVRVQELAVYEDWRGALIEGYRSDEIDYQPAMFYGSFTYDKQARGPHEHKNQTDYFVFFGPGRVNFYLWDNRVNSPTYGVKVKLTVGAGKPCSILVPPGVVHGYVAVGGDLALCLNLPNKLYGGINKQDEIDEIRHEANLQSSFKFW